METNNRALRALTLLVASFGSFIVLLDGSIIFVALPEIQKDLGTHMSTLQWTVDAYTLPFAALMLTAGTLGDRLGRKKVFLTGLVVFVLGSALCGFAPSVEALIAGRVAQGIGAAAINTGSLSLLVSTFTDLPSRAKAIGVWTAVSGISIALGPLIGGILVDAFTWQAIFLVNLPIGALALALGAARLLESRDPSGRGIDAIGQVLATGGLAALVIALIEGERHGWGSMLILSLFAAALVLLVGFALYERRSADPLLPLDLFANRTFTAACLIASLLGFVIVGAMFFMAQYFMSVQGHEPLAAGLRLLPLTLGIFFFSPPASSIAAKVGPRVPVIIGSVLVVLGFALLSTIESNNGFGSIWWKLGLTGAGIGMMFAPLTVAVMGTVPPQRSGLGSSMINTTRITGFTAGAAILGTVAVARFKDVLLQRLMSAGTSAAEAREIVNAVGDQGAAGAVAVGSTLGRVVQEAYVDAMHVVFYVCCAIALVACGLAVTLMLRGPLPAADRPGDPTGSDASGAGRSGAALSGSSRTPPSDALVSSSWLVANLGRPETVVIECSVQLTPRPEGGVDLASGEAEFRRAHIPGAVFADLLGDFSEPGLRPFSLPDVGRLVQAFEALGVSNESTVVLYDRAHNAYAAWMWWILTSLGHTDVLVLDGGFINWEQGGYPTTHMITPPVSGNFVPHPRNELFVGRADVDRAVMVADKSQMCLVNALSASQHAGAIPVAHGRRGHIPGSVNLPAINLVDPSTGCYRDAEELRSEFAEAGALDADQVITYCAAGVNAASVAFVLMGLGASNVTVYGGGLVEWSADPARPLTVTV